METLFKKNWRFVSFTNQSITFLSFNLCDQVFPIICEKKSNQRGTKAFKLNEEIIQRFKYSKWINKLFSEENKVPEAVWS